MSPKAQLQAFAQSIYLTIKNRYFDDIEGEDGVVFVNQMIDWTNMFLDELENETDTTGGMVDWWFSREAAFPLGTATEGEASVPVPTSVDRLITDEQRYVLIQQGDSTVSRWAVVHPRDITNRSNRVTEDMCAVVGTSLVFSRAFNDTEGNGSVVGDVITRLPRLSTTNVKVLSIVRPKQLLILGVAKNATLPDIVQGKLSPSYAQKFSDLLQGAIARSNATSVAAQASRESFSDVRGIY